MPRYESTTKKFVNDNVIEQVPGTGKQGAAGAAGATGPTGPTGPAGSGLPISADDGTNTVTIDQSSHDLRLYNKLDAGSVLKSRLILSADGTAYIEAADQILITSYLGTIKDVQLLAGTGGNWSANCRVQSNGTSTSTAGMTAKNGGTAYHVDIDVGAFSQPTFRVGSTTAAFASLFQKLTTAIPDGDLAASGFGMWLDDTPGATKIMFKAKDSGGTVRTGSIALT